MKTVTRKTEIEPLDGTPEKRMFWSIISDYDLQTGLTELIDNAVDLWVATGKAHPLKVELTLDVDRQMISLIDNAGGVRREELRLLIAPGGSNNSPDAEVIGIFGVGSKRAVIALAEQVSVKTHHISDGSYQVDITREWLESDNWELAAYQIPDIEPGKTRIDLSDLRKPIDSSDEAILIKHFGEVYADFLKSDLCEIVVNKKRVIRRRFDKWAYPPGFEPQIVRSKMSPDGTGDVNIEVMAGLINDRDPSGENYGVYFYCNNRLVVKELRIREVGYFVSSEAGVPHPDASLCRAIVRMTGPAKLMPWNSTKTGVNYNHPAFANLRPTLIRLVSHFSSLSRRLKHDWDEKVFPFTNGEAQIVSSGPSGEAKKLVLPPLPRVNKPRGEKIKAKNKKQIQEQPWTLGLIEAVVAVEFIERQKLETRNRIALILLDSNFEIALKEFIVHRADLFNPRVYDDAKIKEIFSRRHKVIQEVMDKVPGAKKLLDRARHYYEIRNKLIHERATVGIPDSDIENYRAVIEELLHILFGLEFS